MSAIGWPTTIMWPIHIGMKVRQTIGVHPTRPRGMTTSRITTHTSAPHATPIATARGARWTVWFALSCYAAAGAVMLFTAWPGPLAAVVALPYLATVWPFRGVTDATAVNATRGWDRFLWLNQLAGFLVTLLLIWFAILTA